MIGEMNSEVFVADADGSHVRNLTNHPSFEGWPAWSPDGKQIAFAGNRNSSYQIFVMDADGGNVRLVANTEGRATAPKWSPDGTKIYFTNCRNVDFGRGCEILVAKAPPDAKRLTALRRQRVSRDASRGGGMQSRSRLTSLSKGRLTGLRLLPSCRRLPAEHAASAVGMRVVHAPRRSAHPPMDPSHALRAAAPARPGA